MKTTTLKSQFNLRNKWNGFLYLLIAIVFIGCSKDDGPEIKPIEPVAIVDPIPEVEKSVFGKWEVTSGQFVTDNTKYVYINEDNTINILSEDTNGFKGSLSTNITVSDNQIVISSGEGGSSINNYVHDEDTLTIQPPYGGEVKLSRVNDAPELSNWIIPLTILNEGNAPWDEEVDIAFNGTHILFGNGYEADNIGLVNPSSFVLEGEIITSKSAFAVEVEKYDGIDKYIFQSDNGSAEFTAFNADTNAQVFQSNALGPWIKGLASVDETRLWVSSSNESKLYLYKYEAEDEILETIPLDFQPHGMDYQNGFLYVSDGRNIHKCKTTPNFEVVASYGIPNRPSYGIAYDGTNFWLNTYSSDRYKLVKVDLSI